MRRVEDARNDESVAIPTACDGRRIEESLNASRRKDVCSLPPTPMMSRQHPFLVGGDARMVVGVARP